MVFKFTLKKYFFAFFFFVVCPLVGWIIYAHRHNAPPNVFLDNGRISANGITIPDNQLDFSTPFYQNDASLKLEKEQGRPTLNDEENDYFHGQPKEASRGEANTNDKENK